MIAIPVPEGHKKINPLPLILRRWALVAIHVFELDCVASIVSLLRSADSSHEYHTTYPHIRLVAKYVPAAVGTITTVVVRALLTTVARIQPYISMADQGSIGQCRVSKYIGSLYVPGLRTKDIRRLRKQDAALRGDKENTQSSTRDWLGYEFCHSNRRIQGISAQHKPIRARLGCYCTPGDILDFDCIIRHPYSFYLWILYKMWSPNTGLNRVQPRMRHFYFPSLGERIASVIGKGEERKRSSMELLVNFQQHQVRKQTLRIL